MSFETRIPKQNYRPVMFTPGVAERILQTTGRPIEIIDHTEGEVEGCAKFPVDRDSLGDELRLVAGSTCIEGSVRSPYSDALLQDLKGYAEQSK